MSERGRAAGGAPSRSGRGIWLRAGLLALALLLVLGLLAIYRSSSLPRPQALDPQPREFTLPDYLPEGQAQARFDLYSGDSPDSPDSPQPRQTGLVVRWGYENKGFWQIIASCREVGRGNVLGEFGGRVLDIALCDGKVYSLVAEGGSLEVKRGGEVDVGPVVLRQALPRDLVSTIVREKE